MPTTHQWGAFLLAAVLFIQVPGPSLLFTIGRALTVGRRDALLSVVGNALGLTLQVLLVAAGLGAVVAASATAYTVVKVVGAMYVVWLGVQAVRRRGDARRALEAQAHATAEVARRASPLTALRIGATVGATNPKTLVFFVAFLPQFTNASGLPAGVQVAALGLVFALLAVCSDSVWALAASRARDWFTRRPERLDGLGAAGGSMMVALGTSMLVADR
ncbi:LysE family translocator [Nocardioides zeae]|uniref:LysE family translocator n=1 Tax=Nocardioides imazamoxiresistens TaxID=3231893 RepID=A0ABU3PVD2_9ACTN|nr:LysE family translocator [Nocardioides zeae]MDT9593197.1 LysE family translocator [Nocardioides zeae]